MVLINKHRKDARSHAISVCKLENVSSHLAPWEVPELFTGASGSLVVRVKSCRAQPDNLNGEESLQKTLSRGQSR